MSGQLERRFHESTSRALCRLAFLVLGGLPLVGCFVFCLLQFFPQYHRWHTGRWEQELGSVVGLSIHIAAVETRSPEETVLHDVRVTHPETGSSLARAKQVQVVRARGHWRVQLIEPELEGRSMPAGWQQLHETMLCRPRPNAVATKVAMEQLVIHTEGGVQSLDQVSIEVYSQQNSTQLSLEFSPTVQQPAARGRQVANPSVLIMKRTHAEDQLTTKTQFRSGTTALPCSLVQLGWPAAASFGSNATFAGIIDLSLDSHGWRLDIRNQVAVPGETEPRAGGLLIQQIDFGKLCWATPAEMTGTGGLGIKWAQITQAGIEGLNGWAVIDNGRVSSSLLNSLEALGIEVAPDLANFDVRDRSFEQALCQFEIAPASLRICGAAPDGRMLNDARGTMAKRSNWEQQIPLWQLISVLDKSSSPAMEATEGTPHSRFSRLALRWLPLEAEEIRVSQNAVQLSTN